MIHLAGECTHIVYSKDFFSVAWFDVGVRGEIKVAGNYTARVGATYDLIGTYAPYINKRGEKEEQFEVDRIFEKLPSDEEGIRAFLMQGRIAGIGKGNANRLVNAFGADTWNVLKNNPEKILEVEGIGERTLEKIKNSLIEHFPDESKLLIIQELMQCGVTYQTDIEKIYRHYGADCVNIVREEPYRLVQDIDGIGFKKADDIAMYQGFSVLAPERLEAAIKHILREKANSGHTAVSYGVLMGTLLGYLELEAYTQEVKQIVEVLIEDGVIMETVIDGVRFISSLPFYQAEHIIAQRLLSLQKHQPSRKTTEEDLTQYLACIDPDLRLSNGQKTAILTGLNESVSIITGGPGVGKTTVIKTLVEIFKLEGRQVALAAPTGKAAKRMSEVVGEEAKTIHRLLEWSFDPKLKRLEAMRDESNPLSEDVIIIDESSMIDVTVMECLMRAVGNRTSLIFVGDVDQLPAVGPGCVLKDMISSERIPVTYLTEVFRQEAGSMIVKMARRINAGELFTPTLEELHGSVDFYITRRSSDREIRDTIVEFASERVFDVCENISNNQDIQVLTPAKSGTSLLRVYELNVALQEKLNPSRLGWPELYSKRTDTPYVFREGDKVMQMRNNYGLMGRSSIDGSIQYGVFNGSVGVVLDIDADNDVMLVEFDDVWYEYVGDDINDLVLAYATTVHKSQGAEWPVIIMPIWSFGDLLMVRNLLYTAVTRAKSLVILVGDVKAANKMIANGRCLRRYTLLASLLRA